MHGESAQNVYAARSIKITYPSEILLILAGAEGASEEGGATERGGGLLDSGCTDVVFVGEGGDGVVGPPCSEDVDCGAGRRNLLMSSPNPILSISDATGLGWLVD